MIASVLALPPAFVAARKAEARAALDNPEASPSLKRLAWRFLLAMRRAA